MSSRLRHLVLAILLGLGLAGLESCRRANTPDAPASASAPAAPAHAEPVAAATDEPPAGAPDEDDEEGEGPPPPQYPSATEPARPVNLLAGAAWQFSDDLGHTWSGTAPAVRGGTVGFIQARVSLPGRPEELVRAELDPVLKLPPHYIGFRFNGQPVEFPPGAPLAGKVALPPEVLRPDGNSITAQIVIDNAPSAGNLALRDARLVFTPRLIAWQPADLRLITPPVLGAFGQDFFTVTCRTNMPAQVKLIIEPNGASAAARAAMTITSTAMLDHRFRVARPGGEPRDFRYHVEATCRQATVSTKWHPVHLPRLSPEGAFRLVAMGDSRSNRKAWGEVAQAVLAAQPDVVVFSGDMVYSAENEADWSDFIWASTDFFARLPFYAVMGNHDVGARLFPLIFYSPSPDGTDTNWSQRLGPVQLIGIDTCTKGITPEQTAAFLKAALAGSDARFIFAFVHHPGWSTGGRTSRLVRDTVIPLLTEYHATALFTGHEHVYERSELAGLTQVISGSAGAPTTPQAQFPERVNPHCVVYALKLHFCLLEVNGQSCTMRALTPSGTQLDTRTWQARK